MPITSTTSSPPESGFTPRKEFIRDIAPNPPNSFALLAISSSNFIRLYSFSPNVVASLRLLFEAQGVSIATREDQHHNLYEFSVDGKPWANPKSVTTEKLLIDIFAIVYQAGFSFLSCIDYGREHDDRLAMAFSKPEPTPVTSRTGTPLPPGGSPFLGGDSLHKIPAAAPTATAKRIPFALSFASTTVMRVIAPPLHLTPAILQAVRASWPRGVVSEKKVGENSFEFKLKGYKWFQQDNFASDSLQHILSLLTSLDGHSFTLLTSLSLTNRSRVKDLWIFTGPTPEHTSGDDSSSLHRIESNGNPQRVTQHRRQVSEPLALPTASSSQYHHTRAMTEDMSQRSPATLLSQTPQLLRKPAPRAQVPVSVIQEQDLDADGVEDEAGDGTRRRYDSNNRINLPSIISTGAENMTGVGAIGQSLAHPDHAPFDPSIANRPPPTKDSPRTPPLGSTSSSPPVSPKRRQHDSGSGRGSSPLPHITHSVIPPLLSGNPFRGDGDELYRNSTLSQASSDMSGEIPIKWTGGSTGDTTRRKIPGSWQGVSSPIDEDEEDPFTNTPVTHYNFGIGTASQDDAGKPAQATTPIHETLGRVESPEIVNPNTYSTGLRKSEAALVGIIAATSVSQSPSSGTPQSSDSHRSSRSGRVSGQNNAIQSPAHPQGNQPRLPSSSSLSSSGHGHTGKEKDTGSSSKEKLAVSKERERPSGKLTKSNVANANSSSTGGQGWVLVNVEGAPHSNHGTPQIPSYVPTHLRSEFPPPSGLPSSSTEAAGNLHVTNLTPPLSSSSAASNTRSPPAATVDVRAKAIVIVDALEHSKGRKDGSGIGLVDDEGQEIGGSGGTDKKGGVRRFFSLNRRNSVQQLKET